MIDAGECEGTHRDALRWVSAELAPCRRVLRPLHPELHAAKHMLLCTELPKNSV